MGEKIQKGDFIEVDYTGSIKDGEKVFDTTDKDIAVKEELFSDKMKYGPVSICVGHGHILDAIDNFLEGKDTESEYDVDFQPEDAFGRKDGKKIQLIATTKFTNSKIKPFPGLQVNVDGEIGIIKSVSGGRTIVDFNHPLSGKIVHYHLKIGKKMTDDKEKIAGYLQLVSGKDIKFNLDGNDLTITDPGVAEEYADVLKGHLKDMIGKDYNVKVEKSVKSEPDK